MTGALALTNRESGRRLLENLRFDLAQAKSCRLIVSFLMESGARLMLPDLKELANRGVHIRILTGEYLGVTEPSALYLLRSELGNGLDMRIFNGNRDSFHPKAYFLDLPDDQIVYVGSSNLSKSALTGGMEWNFRLPRSLSPSEFDHFHQTFERLFLYDSFPVDENWLRTYAENWRQTMFNRESAATPATIPVNLGDSLDDFAHRQIDVPIQPRGAQIEALHYLRLAREEGVTKGLVVAATGVGKTYLAAFDSREYKRILFVAHREEILKQAAASFHKVRPDATIGYFIGNTRETDADIVFATVQTLGRMNAAERSGLAPDSFDYIVVDEFHHAAATSYRNILAHFTPNFLLGLTATPYRMDQQDIFALCEDQVIYEIHLNEAINRGILCPFKYYAVYDATVDYDKIDRKNGKYDQEQLERSLSLEHRAALVLEKFRQFGGSRSLGFCAGVRHADFMAEYFHHQGIASASVHSQASDSKRHLDRHLALEQLKSGTLRVLFCVDLFNEGVDAPLVDTVMFLRPTDSYTVFLQQLGRGLRQAPTKDYLTVLDFIGNYRRAHQIPLLLVGKNPMELTSKDRVMPHRMVLPEGCIANFDFRLIDLFEELRKKDPLSLRLRDEIERLARELGRPPRRADAFSGSDIRFREFTRAGWIRLLIDTGLATPEEAAWLDSPVGRFLECVERTSMSKSFKIPTISSFIENGTWSCEVDEYRISQMWRTFYTPPQHARDLTRHGVTEGWAQWDDRRLAAHAWNNPVHFLTKTHPEYFGKNDERRTFFLQPQLHPHLTTALADHLRDILEVRTLEYFARGAFATPEEQE